MRRFRQLTPTIVGAGATARCRFLVVVDFDQCGQPEPGCRFQQRPQLGIAQRRHDQQRRIRAERRRFDQLVVGDDEVLAQDGMSTAALTAARWSGEPSKNVGSVSTEMAAAPASA